MSINWVTITVYTSQNPKLRCAGKLKAIILPAVSVVSPLFGKIGIKCQLVLFAKSGGFL